jgi:hypothetical protein
LDSHHGWAIDSNNTEITITGGEVKTKVSDLPGTSSNPVSGSVITSVGNKVTVTGGTVLIEGYDGRGIASHNSAITISGGRVAANVIDFGAAIEIDNGSINISGASTTVSLKSSEGSTIYGSNTAIHISGGTVSSEIIVWGSVICIYRGSITLSGSANVSLKSAYAGFTIESESTNIQITGGKLHSEVGTGGGTIYNKMGTLNISGSAEVSNKGLDGNTIMSNNGVINISGSANITRDGDFSDGRTINTVGCKISVTGGTVSYTGINGGTISGYPASFTMSGGTVTAHFTSGGLYAIGLGKINMSISGGTISVTGASGTALAFYESTANITGGTISVDVTNGGVAIRGDANSTINVSGTSAKISVKAGLGEAISGNETAINITGGEITASFTDMGHAVNAINGSVSVSAPA